jgi:hypothetical protein
MEKTYSGTEQNMSEKQGKGQIMLHLPMKFGNHVMNRENEFLRSWSGYVEYSKKFLLLSSALLGKMPCNFLSDLDLTTPTS